jgi:hypothetical protein
MVTDIKKLIIRFCKELVERNSSKIAFSDEFIDNNCSDGLRNIISLHSGAGAL